MQATRIKSGPKKNVNQIALDSPFLYEEVLQKQRYTKILFRFLDVYAKNYFGFFKR